MAVDRTVSDEDLGYYVYALVPAGSPEAVPSGLRGLDDVEVQVVTVGDVAAVVSSLALERPPGRRAELEAHTRVVDGLARAGPVVPVRFGSVLEHDVAAVEELLADQGPAALATLERVEGKVQLNLRVSYHEQRVLEEVVNEDPDIAQLRRRTRDLPEGAMHPDLVALGERVAAAVERKRLVDADDVLAAVEHRDVEISEREGGGLDHVIDLALLVPLQHLDPLEETLEQLAEQTHERLRWRLVGPVAPYDFAREVAWG